MLSISNSGLSCNVTVKNKKMAAGRNVLNFNVKCFQDNGSFLHPAKRQMPINYQRPKKKKNSAKTSLKKKLKDRWKENAKKKEKRMKLPARIVLHIADTTHIYT